MHPKSNVGGSFQTIEIGSIPVESKVTNLPSKVGAVNPYLDPVFGIQNSFLKLALNVYLLGVKLPESMRFSFFPFSFVAVT